jgi:hypothetical protein
MNRRSMNPVLGIWVKKMRDEKDTMKTPQTTMILRRTSLKYSDIGHFKSGVLWWVDNRNRIQTTVSDGSTYHHDLNRKMDMDQRWRGRFEPGTKRASLMPPIKIKSIADNTGKMTIAIPRRLINRLKQMGATSFLVAVDDRLWVILGRGKNR